MQDKLLAFAEFLPRGLNMTYLIDPNLTVIERSMTASIIFYVGNNQLIIGALSYFHHPKIITLLLDRNPKPEQY
ncbi:hypothetical protein OUZ56_031478 [Daphnia magna]|uniref:Uncharacterized protein n=1 Tax=Daphnia magna TaxID=35525 RepID=A0ABQ9ZUP5_9CRUS|nr:hypothetical protein OUZ56_031478 [Daphnia magna]